jgi:hypothetical protein
MLALPMRDSLLLAHVGNPSAPALGRARAEFAAAVRA